MGGITTERNLVDWLNERERALRSQIIDLKPEVDLEFKIYSFAFSDHRMVGPHNVDAWMENKRKRDQIIEDFLNDGWRVYEQIICPPNVMLVFSREKETEECQQ